MFDFEVKVADQSFTIKEKDYMLVVQEWGENSVRVISSPVHNFTLDKKNGIQELEKNTATNVSIKQKENAIELINNNLKVVYDGDKLVFYNKL